MTNDEKKRIELERWLDRKAEIDMHNTIYRPDQFKRHSPTDVFDEYTESDEGQMRDDLWAMGADGVYAEDD